MLNLPTDKRPFPPISIKLFLIIGAISGLLSGLWTGLGRLGLTLPMPAGSSVAMHGPLMVCCFLGTLIALERAVATNLRWLLLAPILSALAIPLIFIFELKLLSSIMVVASSVLLNIFFLSALRKHPSFHLALMSTGAALLSIGNLFWMFNHPVPVCALWWAAFIIVTIVSERLELGRLLKITRFMRLMVLTGVLTIVIGAIVASKDYGKGIRVAGVGLILVSSWLLKYDIARRTIRLGDLARYAAISLLAGYVWLLVGGSIAVYFGGPSAGPIYDSILHAVFVGFTFSMIFGHAPIILPAIMGLQIPFSRQFYIPLILLHMSMMVRIAGDLWMLPQLRIAGGVFNIISVLAFFIVMKASNLRSNSHSEN